MNVMKMDVREKIIYWYEKHWEAGFVKWWRGYETLALHDGLHERGVRTFEEALLNMNEFVGKLLNLDKYKEARILDAGCGVGGTSIYLGNKFPNINFIGITISREQVELARKFAKKRNFNNNTDFLLMDYMKTAFPDNYFDGIFALESISYAPDKKNFIEEMNRILKPGGRLVIICPAIKRNPLNPVLEKIYRWYHSGRGNPYSFPVLKNLLGCLKEKFTDVRVMDISRNIIWSEVRAILISIPYVFLVLFKKLLKGKGYDPSKDPSFYLAVAILSPVMGLSKTSGYYAIVGEKDSKII